MTTTQPLSDAALRERAQEECSHAHSSYISCGFCFVQGNRYIALRNAALAELAIPCQRHGCMWDAPEAHEACRAEQSVILEASTAWLEESLRAEERGRAEQREADAKALEALAVQIDGLYVDWDGKELKAYNAAKASFTSRLIKCAAAIRAQGFDPIADHKLSEWNEQGGEK